MHLVICILQVRKVEYVDKKEEEWEEFQKMIAEETKVIGLATLQQVVLANTFSLREKSVGTTELHYSTKKREHCFSILKAFFVRHSSEYETSDSDRKVKRNI